MLGTFMGAGNSAVNQAKSLLHGASSGRVGRSASHHQGPPVRWVLSRDGGHPRANLMGSRLAEMGIKRVDEGKPTE